MARRKTTLGLSGSLVLLSSLAWLGPVSFAGSASCPEVSLAKALERLSVPAETGSLEQFRLLIEART